MKQKHFVWWITLAGFIGIIFGIFYTFFGLEGLPVYQKFVPKSYFEEWSRSLYGAVFIGFSILMLFVGRRIIQNKDRKLAKILIWGIGSWLIVEAVSSLIYHVYINIVVDMLIMVFLSLPLLKGTRK